MVCLDYVIRQKQLVLCLYFFYLILLCLQNSSFERWNSSKIFSMRLKKFAKIHHWILLSSSRSHFFRHAWSVQNRPCINVWKENVSLFLSNQAHCESIIIVAEYKNRNGLIFYGSSLKASNATDSFCWKTISSSVTTFSLVVVDINELKVHENYVAAFFETRSQ